MIFNYYNRPITLETLRRTSRLSHDGTSFRSLKNIATKHNFRALSAKVTLQQLKQLNSPLIAHWESSHFIVVYEVKRDSVTIADPLKGLKKLSMTKFLQGWQVKGEAEEEPYGHCLLLEPLEEHEKTESDESTKRRLSPFIKQLKEHMLHFSRYFPAVITAFIIGNALQLLTPFLTQGLVDVGIAHRDINFIYLMIMGTIFLYVSRFVIDFFRSYILLHISVRMNISLVYKFIKKLITLPLSFYENRKMFDIIKRVEDHDMLKMFITEELFGTIFHASSLIILLGVLCHYSFTFFIIYLIGTLLYIIWISYFLKQRQEFNRKRFEIDTNAREIVYDLVDGIQDIKVYNYGDKKLDSWTEEQHKLFKFEMKYLLNSNAIRIGGIFFNYVKDMVIMLFAALAVVEGDITVGGMMAIQSILGQLIMPINQLIQFFQSLAENQVGVERINEIYDMESPPPPETTPQLKPGTIDIKGVTFGYHSEDEPAISDINLTVPEKSFTLIVGKSGCGKTTLLKILLGYYDDYRGEITINNTPFNTIGKNRWQESYSSLLQGSFVFYDTIRDNILMGDDYVNQDRLQWAMEIACFDEVVAKLPRGLDTYVGRKGLGLSRGQIQRMQLARCFYKESNYLFLDEATNALDPLTEKRVLTNIKRELSDRTVFFISHNIQNVKLADQIAVMDEGRIVELGDYESLMKRGGRLHALYHFDKESGKEALV